MSRIWVSGIVTIAAAVCLLAASTARAQFNTNAGAGAGNSDPSGSGGGTKVPNVVFPAMPIQTNNLTPQQWQAIIQMRALQSRGRGQVRTGYPQFIPFGMPATIPYAPQIGQAAQQYQSRNRQAGQNNPQQAAGAADPNQIADPDADPQDGHRLTPQEKRAAARKAAEDKKAAAREAREAKLKERAEKARRAREAREGKTGNKADDADE